MKIYFAGSIRGGRQDQELYGFIVKLLQNYGEVLTEHVADHNITAHGEDGPDDASIYNRDLKWLGECDAVVAETTQPSLGVGYEIAKAEELGKPILCLWRASGERRLSAMIAGSAKVMVKEYQTREELPGLLQDFFRKK